MDQSSKDPGNREQAEKSDSQETRHRDTPPLPPPVDPVDSIIKDPPDGDS